MATASTSTDPSTGDEVGSVPNLPESEEQAFILPPQVSALNDRLLASKKAVKAKALREVLDKVATHTTEGGRTRNFIKYLLTNVQIVNPSHISELLKHFCRLADLGGVAPRRHLPNFYSYLGSYLLKTFFESFALGMSNPRFYLKLDINNFRFSRSKLNLSVQEAFKDVDSMLMKLKEIEDAEQRRSTMTALVESPTLESLRCISAFETWNSSIQTPYSEEVELKIQPMLVVLGNLIKSHQWFFGGSPNEELRSTLELILLCSSPTSQNLLIKVISELWLSQGTIFGVNEASKRVLQSFQGTATTSSLDELLSTELLELQALQKTAKEHHATQHATAQPGTAIENQQLSSEMERMSGTMTTTASRNQSLQSTEKKPTLQAGISASPSPSTQSPSLLSRKGDLGQVPEETVDSPSLKRLRNASQPNLQRGSESNDPSFPTSSTIPGSLSLQADTTSSSMDQDQDVSNVSSNQSTKPSRKRAATMSQVGNQIEIETPTSESNQQRSASIFGAQDQTSSTLNAQLSQTHQQSNQSASQSSKDQAEQQKKLNASSVLQLGLPSEIENEKQTVEEVEKSIQLLKASILKVGALSSTDAINYLQKALTELQIIKSEREKQVEQSSTAAATPLQLSENKKGGQESVDNENGVEVEAGKDITTEGERTLLLAVSRAIKDFEEEQPLSHPSFDRTQVEPQLSESTTSSDSSLLHLAQVSTLLETKDLEPAEAQRNHSVDLASLQNILTVAISGFESFKKGKTESSLEFLSSFSSSQLLKKGAEVLKLRNRGNRPIAAEFNSQLLASSSTSILEVALETYLSTLPADAAEGLRKLMETEVQEKDSNDVQAFYKQTSAQLKDWIKGSGSVRNLVPASKLLVDIIVDHSAVKASLLLPSSTLTALSLDTHAALENRFDPNFESKMREVRESLFKSFLKFQEGSSNLESQQRLN